MDATAPPPRTTIDRPALDVARIPLSLGPDVIAALLPHRRPFVMIDRITGFARGATPALWASRHVSANEEIFAGHFPGLHLWPGVYTIEGMGQACHALASIEALEIASAARRDAALDVVGALENEALGARLDGAFRRDTSVAFRALLASFAADAPRGLAAAVDVRLLAPVFAGERIDFFVARAKTFGRLARFEVEASVDGRVVARGALTSALTGGEAPNSVA